METMVTEELVDRLHRIYAAVEAAVEGDLSKFPPRVTVGEHNFRVYQDFLGGLTEPQLSNLAHAIIHNIANLRDHLRHWARKNCQNQNDIDKTITNCPALQIIIDLSNNDKHGYPPRDGGHSKRSPKLVEVKRVLTIGPGTALIFTPNGLKQTTSGDGSSQVIVDGTVVDINGVPIGDLYDLWNEALKAWEQQIKAFGIFM